MSFHIIKRNRQNNEHFIFPLGNQGTFRGQKKITLLVNCGNTTRIPNSWLSPNYSTYCHLEYKQSRKIKDHKFTKLGKCKYT